MNRVILIGNLGKDPESKSLESGVTVTNFVIATSESYKPKDSDERVTKVEWHNCVAWRGLADVIAKYPKKGDKIAIEGKLQTRSWEDKEGNKRYTTEIVVDNMEMLGRKAGESESEAVPPVKTPPEDVKGPPESDDLPF